VIGFRKMPKPRSVSLAKPYDWGGRALSQGWGLEQAAMVAQVRWDAI
jgi:hypothetical protein